MYQFYGKTIKIVSQKDLKSPCPSYSTFKNVENTNEHIRKNCP